MCYVEDDVTITPPNEEIVEGIENEEELENENGSETIDFNT